MLEIRPLGPDDPAFPAWHEVIASAYAEGREPGWWESLEATRSYFADPGTRTRHHAFVALGAGLVVGGAELSLPLHDDTQTVSVQLGVARSHRGRGVGAVLAAYVAEVARREDRHVLQAELVVPADVAWSHWPGGRFAERYGLRSVSTEDRFLLDLPVDAARLGALGRALPTEPGVRVVSWLGSCPDEHLVEWARMQTQMNQDVPVGELTRSARPVDVAAIRESDLRMASRGWTKVRSMAVSADGAGRGYTEMFVESHDLRFVVQDDTLVDRAHRGRHLGMRLKLANLRQLHAHAATLIGPRRWIQTFTEQGNAAMQRTNERVGFRRVDVLHECEGTLTSRAGT